MAKRKKRYQKQAKRVRARKAAAKRSGHVGPNTTVYSAAAWWRDMDPSMQVIALDAAVTREKLKALMEEEAERAFEDEQAYAEEPRYESADDAMDGIAWSGVHPFALKDVVSGRELEEAIDELRDNGYYYPETP